MRYSRCKYREENRPEIAFNVWPMVVLSIMHLVLVLKYDIIKMVNSTKLNERW